VNRASIAISVTNDLIQDQRMHRICKTLYDAGYNVTLIGRLRQNSSPIDDKVYKQVRLRCFFDSGFLFYLEYNLRLLLHLSKHRYEVLYSVDLDTIGAVGTIARLTGRKHIHDAHEYFVEVPELQGAGFKKWIWNRIAHSFLHRADLRYTVNEELATELERVYRCPFGVVRSVPEMKNIISDQQAWLGINLLDGTSKNYQYSLANKFFDYMHAEVPSINMAFPTYKRYIDADKVGLVLDRLDVSKLQVLGKVLMGGSGSTGSSLLKNILNRNERIFSGGETAFLSKRLVYDDWPKAKKRLQRRKTKGLRNFGFHIYNGTDMCFPEYLWKPDELDSAAVASMNLDEFCEVYFGKALELTGATTWIEKTPANAACFASFLNHFQDSKVIHMVRNPYDTIASLCNRGFSLHYAVGRYADFWRSAMIHRCWSHRMSRLQTLNSMDGIMMRHRISVRRPSEDSRNWKMMNRPRFSKRPI